MKAGRVPTGARAADATVQEAYKRVLGDGFRQINCTYRAIQDRVPEFAHIPKDRPIIGMVGTLDPWYNANSFARDFLPATDIPTVVADVRDIEMLIGIGQQRSVAQILREITDENDERKMWELGLALRSYQVASDRNPILEEAWQRLPFTQA